MPKRKSVGVDDRESETVPLPIQTFLWRQTSPFIRPKLGKLCEATCVTFERVLVQNILHGLSPSLCEAIQSISRWRVIQAAFPHVMHCCAAVLANRKQTDPNSKFGMNEIKLMYTLHWIILDAASECEDLDTEKSVSLFGKNLRTYLHSMETIQLFVYLFAPLISSLRSSDFESLKLENGLRLWQPLWDYSQPDVPCLATPVKPKRNVLKAQRNLLRVNTNAANIYVGKGTSTDNIYLGFEDHDAPTSRSSVNEPASPLAPLARMSDICAASTISDAQSVSVEVVCEVCSQVVYSKHGETSCKCGPRRPSNVSVPEAHPMPLQKLVSPTDREYMTKRLESAIASGIRGPQQPDVLSASYFDVAVLRCLFCPQWQEDGIYWATRYIHQRLLEVNDEMRHIEYSRERSKSLPVPEIHISLCRSPTPTSPTAGKEEDEDHPRLTEPSVLSHRDSLQVGAHPPPPERKEPAFKRKRVTELKQMFEGKVKQLRRRESQEQFDLDTKSTKSYQEDSDRASPECLTDGTGTDEETLPRPSSALAKLAENDEDSYEEDQESNGSSSDIVRRKSMPSLRRHEKYAIESDSDSGSGKQGEGGRKESITRAMSLKPELLQKPIITITEDSPEPSPSLSDWSARKRESVASQKSDLIHKPVSLQRSLTDSNIQYDIQEEVTEVPGSACYIQASGHLNYFVVLRAAHSVASRECSSRVCGVLLNIINCLIDLGVIEKKEKEKPEKGEKDEKEKEGDKGDKESKPEGDSAEKKEEPVKKKEGELTCHNIAMETVMRVFKTIGCPHGCGDGYRGSIGNHLRAQGIACLNRLQQRHSTMFRTYLQTAVMKHPVQDITDFLHALLGFCVDPSPYSPQSSGPKKDGGRTGYANNFGQPPNAPKSVESILIGFLLKPLVTKFVDSWKDLLSHENIGLYCDVCQLMNFVKETQGGTFRRVALSGLLDALGPRLHKKEAPKTTKVVRRTMSITSESGDERDSQRSPASSVDDCSARARRSLFRKKTKKNLITQYGAASDSEMLDENSVRQSGKLSPRVSLSAAEDDPPSGPTTPKRKFSKFNIAWKRATKSDHEDDSASEMPSEKEKEKEARKENNRSASGEQSSGTTTGRPKARMSFRAASQATLTFLSARKRIEDGLKSWSKRRLSKRGSLDDDLSRRGSLDVNNAHSTEVIIVREKQLVNAYMVKCGMLRFNFMLDCCHPGSIPDPHLIAALLDLEAPVVARASLLLECAHFINRCNRQDWPNWMKLNLPSFRQSGLLHSRSQPSGFRRNKMLQRDAGRMFHMWGEAIGNRLYELLNEENHDRFTVIHQVKDENKRKELRLEDDEEDFLDEATVNHTGSDCPYALKMVACQVLLEITTFLRETYQYIPKNKATRRDFGWDKPVSSRRWSSAMSSPGHSERSNSRSSQGEAVHVVGSPGDRKISFAVLGQADRSDSIHSSTTTISNVDGLNAEGKARRLAAGRKLLKMRRGSGHNSSIRHNRSFKLKRQEGGSMKRIGSLRSRKVSSHSIRSDKSDDEHSGEADSGGMGSDDTVQESPDHSEEEQDYSKSMPWIKVVISLANTSNFICDHHNFCHPNCYERQRRSCTRLMTAIKRVYDSEADTMKKEDKKDKKIETFRDKLKRRESLFQPSSPTRRRESTPLLEKIKTDVNLARAKIAAALEKKEEPAPPPKPKDEMPIVKYIKGQVQNLTQSPMAIITKAAPILAEDSFIDMLPVAWELLLESDQELAASAATTFIISSVKAQEQVQEMMAKELQHEDVGQRINAILRFSVLWRFRYQVWPRMEVYATMFFKVPPPNIDFVLPSPTIGLPSLTVVDPPWMPHFKTKVEEVTLNQEESKTFVTATTTRRKQQQEMIHRALLAEEERRRASRENFHITSIPITNLAADEPALHHGGEEHEEAIQEELNLAARRMSVAPINRASNVPPTRNMSWRHGSIHWARPTIYEGDEERIEHVHSQQMQMATHFFPSCICMAALPIIHLLDDLDVNSDGTSVSEVAEKVVWECLVEEPVLFLRTFLEKLTHRDKLEELVFVLRKLLYHIQELPAQTAHTLFNYVLGFVMFYVRSPTEGGQDAIAEALSILWQIVPSVRGIFFKDLKQTLRKEQCDPSLLITANVPSAKKLIVHGPDLASIPSQFPIHEYYMRAQLVMDIVPHGSDSPGIPWSKVFGFRVDTQFEQILTDSLEFFNIPDDEQNSYCLVDTKTNLMHNGNSYVRDFYFFRRMHYPQLSLVHMNPDDAIETLQRQAFVLKSVESGKVLFSLAILQGTQQQQIQNHVSFLHEELLKLPSFPRKALETEFGLHRGRYGKELYGLDMLHKYVWAKLMGTMFADMSSTTTATGDLVLFLNVVNGTLLLHSEDTAMLRLCIAIFINASRHFKQVFASSGFILIMQTMLRVYSNHQSNPVVCHAIEFACKQFYILHRKPFMLQMFGSVAPILHMNADPNCVDYNKVHPRCLFELLLALEKECPDSLDILDLVEGEKPLMAMDFCYLDDSDSFTMIDAVNMCVTVVAYAPDSVRAMQMLQILEAILPYYLKHIKGQTCKRDNPSAARAELNTLQNLAISMKALVISCEVLGRNFSGPQRHLVDVNPNVKPTANHSNHSPQAPTIYFDEPSDIRFMEEGRRRHHQTTDDDAEAYLKEFRQPRHSLLCVVAEFYHQSFGRVKELRRLLSDPTLRTPEMLDLKAHNRLADVAHTLLKVAPYDPPTMRCGGLQRYMTEILPITDWSQEAVRPALNLILRRLERLFSKIYKKAALRRHLDWNAAANLLKGVHATLAKYSFVAHLPHLKRPKIAELSLKTLINVCLNIILADECGPSMWDSMHNVPHRSEGSQTRIAAPPVFCSAVVKLTAMQIQALGVSNKGPVVDQYSLEHICGGMSVFPTAEKTTNMLVNLILPLCIRMGCGRRDTPRMHAVDISFSVTIILNALLPPSKQSSSTASKAQHLSVSDVGRTSSLTYHEKKLSPKENMQNVAFLGLKMVMVCFEKQLMTEWSRIAKCVQSLGNRLQGGVPLWRFLDFVVTVRPPLFILLQPFILYKMMKQMCETEQEYFLQQMVHQKMQGFNMPHPKCKATTLLELATELKHIKEELVSMGETRPRTSTISSDRQDYHMYRSGGLVKSSSIHDLLEQHASARLQNLTQALAGGLRYSKVPDQPDAAATAAATASPSGQDVPVGVGAEAGSPGLVRRMSSRRINAHEGSRILEKFAKKQSMQDDEDEVPEDSFLSAVSARKLQRQASIYQRSYITKQAAICGLPSDPMFESMAAEGAGAEAEHDLEGYDDDDKDDQTGQSSVLPLPSMSRPKLRRQLRIIHRGRFRTQHAVFRSSSWQPESTDLELTPLTEENTSEEQGNVSEPIVPKFSEKSDAVLLESPADYDPRHHRLQRADAKSRKTFKIKRHRSTIKGNVIRSATVKGSLRVNMVNVKAPAVRTVSAEPMRASLERLETQPEEDVSEAEAGGVSPAATEEPQVSFKSGRGNKTYLLTRSRSHDEGGSNGAYENGTAGKCATRGGIARQGARMIKSRSPSSSPPRRPASPNADTQAYVAKCDSIESLSNGESSALLKDEDKSKSQSSLLIFFDTSDVQDTCV